jgi:cleavage and polyadenylation specificity factor subunit 1
VRALDMDERLVGVAFLDVGVHVTSLRTMKNLLVIGDAVKSIWFVAFQVCMLSFLRVIAAHACRMIQEDPYKLVVLAKDVSKRAVTKADLFFNSKDMSIISGDEDGVIRLYAYDPQGVCPAGSIVHSALMLSHVDPESKAGQELLCRSEFHGQVECRTTLTIARRGTDDVVLPESKLLMGTYSFLRSHTFRDST